MSAAVDFNKTNELVGDSTSIQAENGNKSAVQAKVTEKFTHRGERPLESAANKIPIVGPEDTLEYFIKFPAPQYEGQSNVQDDYHFNYNETNAPVVMLLGWAGCQDRYLMKYSKIYEERG